MTSDSRDRRREAAEWFARLNQKRVTSQDVRDFNLWRKTPENRAAYERVESLWEAAETIGDAPEILRLRAHAKAGSEPAAQARMRLRQAFVPLGAMVAVAVIGLGVWRLAYAPSQTYATAIGEQRVITLADGSRIELNTDSKIRVRFSNDQRALELVAGQALFDVVPDAQRPFVVAAGETTVTALGTRFDVRRFGDAATVVLVEGRIAVRSPETTAPWVLTPGKALATNASKPAVQAIDAAAATSWTQGRLSFQGVRLDAAIAEVNRYSVKKISLAAPSLSAERISGVFDIGDTASFVAAVTDVYPLDVTAEPDGGALLRPRQK